MSRGDLPSLYQDYTDAANNGNYVYINDLSMTQLRRQDLDEDKDSLYQGTTEDVDFQPQVQDDSF